MRELGELFYPMYRRYFEDEREDFIVSVDRSLSQALIPQSPEIYISKGLAYASIAGVVVWLITLLTVYGMSLIGLLPTGPILGLPVPNEQILRIIEMVKIPFIIIFSAVFVGSLTFIITFFSYIKYPAMISSGRKREINKLLPDALSYMYALSIGGLNQIEIFEAVAAAGDTYGEISQEFNIMLKETEYFETDYRTAIQQHSQRTPSKKLEVFLADMLAILSSGGDLESFLGDQRRKFMRASKQQQEQTLETLELFGEMYMTLSLFPILLIIVMMTMSLMGSADMMMMYGVVYGLIPMLGAGFLVMISAVKEDQIGDGILTIDDRSKDEMTSNSLSGAHLADEFSEKVDHEVFDSIQSTEETKQLKFIINHPYEFFAQNPLYTLFFTVPLAITIVGVTLYNGIVPTTMDAFIDKHVLGTALLLYLPSYIIGLPLAIFYEINQRRRNTITSRLSETLRKMANANETGQTLLESLLTVSESSRGKLSNELEEMYYKVEYGMTLKEAFIEFNNKYRLPRLARTIKLIVKSQETTEEIGEVLTTAAEASEVQDDVERERKSRARMQVAIILMTFLALLGVMAILQTQFVTVMADLANSSGGEGSGGGGGGAQFNVSMDVNELSMLFFHAVSSQAILSGLISGYIRSASLVSGLKYVIILQTIALSTWIAIA